MDCLADILSRNQGSVLTPELIWGIVQSRQFSEPENIYAGIPASQPELAAAHDPRLIVNERNRVGDWIAERVGQHGGWGPFGAIGLLDQSGGSLVAGALLNNITPTNASSHVVIENRHGLKRVLLYAFFDYAFNQLGLERLTGHVSADNAAALRFDQHLGYEHEFTIPKGNGGDLHQLVMWRDRCRWINRGDS